MTDIEKKALKLLNDCGGDALVIVRNKNPWVEALCRAIEQHEAFRQEVSDAMEQVPTKDWDVHPILWRFIIPKPKPDPLREIAEAWGLHNTVAKSWVEDLRATLEARGFEIREKNDD